MSETEAKPEPKQRVRPEGPSLDSLYMVGDDGTTTKLHPADVRGRYQNRKKLIWLILIGIYVVMPWVKIDGRPAILIDIGQRHFFLFGKTFNAQDFYLAFFWVTGLAFSLYVVSALWGRLWCGYACPQTVFLEAIFRKIERTIEGNKSQRERISRAPWTAKKIGQRGLKWFLFLIVSLLLSHTFLGYFMPAEELLAAVTESPSAHPTAFTFILVFTAIIYWNYAWFREQLCIIICPYGRFQSVLYDEHTKNVGYDKLRGEPRAHAKEEDRGDCIDCFRCVAVCPTGIDIRNGTQLECIGCANCVDACDEVMTKLGQDEGLVRYDSLAGFHGKPRKFFRPRTILYGVLMLIGLTVFGLMAMKRTTFEARLLRGSGSLFVVDDNDTISNPMSLHLVNKLSEPRVFRVRAKEPQDAAIVLPLREVELEAFEDRRLPVLIKIPISRYKRGMTASVIVSTGDEEFECELRVLGPN